MLIWFTLLCAALLYIFGFGECSFRCDMHHLLFDKCHNPYYICRREGLNLCMAILHSFELTLTFSFEIIHFSIFVHRPCPWRSRYHYLYACIYVYAGKIGPSKWNIRKLSLIFYFCQSIFSLHFILWVVSAIERLFVSIAVSVFTYPNGVYVQCSIWIHFDLGFYLFMFVRCHTFINI